MPPQRSCIRLNRSLCSSAAFFALALGVMSAPAPALADQPAHVEHSEHDELSESEAHVSTGPKRLLDVYDASSDVRRLLRNGGHGRPGFDDIAWPDAISLPYAQIVDPERYIPGTVSLGTTSDGHLVHGARVPLDGHAHHVLHEHRGRPTHYGTEEIVALVLDAADHYAARYPGERIALGNFSEHEGGDIDLKGRGEGVQGPLASYMPAMRAAIWRMKPLISEPISGRKISSEMKIATILGA